MVPPGFSTSCICRSAATGSGQICIELIANALSKVSFANGRRSTLPSCSSTRLHSTAAAFRAVACLNARDLARHRLFREQLNANTGSETNFQYSVARLNVQQFDNARSDRSIGPGHYDATELSQDAFRPTERAHRQALQRTGPPAHRLLHLQCVCTTETERRLHRRHAIPTSLIVAASPTRRSSQQRSRM